MVDDERRVSPREMTRHVRFHAHVHLLRPRRQPKAFDTERLIDFDEAQPIDVKRLRLASFPGGTVNCTWWMPWTIRTSYAQGIECCINIDETERGSRFGAKDRHVGRQIPVRVPAFQGVAERDGSCLVQHETSRREFFNPVVARLLVDVIRATLARLGCREDDEDDVVGQSLKILREGVREYAWHVLGDFQRHRQIERPFRRMWVASGLTRRTGSTFARWLGPVPAT